MFRYDDSSGGAARSALGWYKPNWCRCPGDVGNGSGRDGCRFLLVLFFHCAFRTSASARVSDPDARGDSDTCVLRLCALCRVACKSASDSGLGIPLFYNNS